MFCRRKHRKTATILLAARHMSDLSSIFIPTDDGADPDTMIRAAITTADAFTACFNTRDLAGMDALLHFPHVILSGEKLIVWDTPGQMPLGFFENLAGATGWEGTLYVERRPVLVNTRKVHLSWTTPATVRTVQSSAATRTSGS